MATDAVVLPLAVALQRTGLTEAEIMSDYYAQQGIQIFRRYMPEQDEPDIAVVVPNHFLRLTDFRSPRASSLHQRQKRSPRRKLL